MRISLRECIRGWYASLLLRSGIVNRGRRTLLDKGLVLLYHQVLDDDSIPADIDPGMYVGRSAFEQQLRYLAEHHEVMSLDGLLEWLDGKRPVTRPPCVITFDDGWADNYSVAFPLLQKYKMPATIFLITDLVGTPDMLSWDQVHEMRESGVSFGSHTATHPVLTMIDDSAVLDELTRSKERLEREFGLPCRWFCYPKGQHDHRSLKIARALYTGALSIIDGPVIPGCDRHLIHRVDVHHDVTRTTALFACRLTSLV